MPKNICNVIVSALCVCSMMFCAQNFVKSIRVNPTITLTMPKVSEHETNIILSDNASEQPGGVYSRIERMDIVEQPVEKPVIAEATNVVGGSMTEDVCESIGSRNGIPSAPANNAVAMALSNNMHYVQTRTDTIYDVFTPEEIEYACRMVETENYQCCFKSKVHCAETVFARYYSEKYPSNLKEIVTAPCQFVYGRTDISPDTILAVEYAWQFATETENCVAFKTSTQSVWWGYSWLLEDAEGQDYYGEPCELAPVE